MRLAWCTPFALRSAIGRFSALVVAEMRRVSGWDIAIWFPQGAGGRSFPDAGTELSPELEKELAEYDAIVYNMGNNAQYHGQLVDVSARYPGLVVMHDTSLTHMMFGRLTSLPRAELVDELTRWYGSAGRTIAEDMLANPRQWPWSLENVSRYPLTESIASSALGIVTHSDFAARTLRGRYAGDIWTLPLPALHLDSEEVAEVAPPPLDDRAIILQAGALNKNKCVDCVLTAFAAAELADTAQLVICGFASRNDLAYLNAEVRRLGLRGSAHVLGAVSDAQLDALRRRAVVATVLRDPCVEAASAVLLDSMAYGMAVVTVPTGHYAEIPDDLVVRVQVPPAVDELAQVLSYLIRAPQAASAMGARARSWVRDLHTPAAYAKAMTHVIEQTGGYERRRHLASDLAETLRRTGFDRNSPVTDLVGAVATELFSGRPRTASDIIYSGVQVGGEVRCRGGSGEHRESLDVAAIRNADRRVPSEPHTGAANS